MFSRYFDTGDAAHAEEKVLGEITSKKLVSRDHYTVLLIDQVPCGPEKHNCRQQILNHAKDPNSGSIRVYTARLYDDPFKSPKTAIKKGTPSTVGAAPELKLTRVRLPILKEGAAAPASGPPSKPPAAPQSKAAPTASTPAAPPKAAAPTTSPQKAAAPKVPSTAKTPSVSPGTKALLAKGAGIAAKEIATDLKILRTARVLGTGMQLMSFLGSIHLFVKFQGMATSRLGGGGFVLTKEVEQSEKIKTDAEAVNESYDAFSERISNMHFTFIQAGQEPHAAKKAMDAITALTDEGDFAGLTDRLPKQIARLKAALKEASNKRSVIEKLLNNPPIVLSSIDQAVLFGAFEDFERIESALMRGVTALEALRKKVKNDKRFLDRWHLALLRKCLEGGVCSFLP